LLLWGGYKRVGENDITWDVDNIKRRKERVEKEKRKEGKSMGEMEDGGGWGWDQGKRTLEPIE